MYGSHRRLFILQQALCLDFALRHRKGCRLWQKVIKNPADLSKMSNLVFYQLNFSNLCYRKKKEKEKEKKTRNSLSKGSIYHKTLGFKIGQMNKGISF